GYVCAQGEQPPILNPQDEPDRLCIQLYHRLASAVDVRDKSVLEIGCGRGGGSSYVARYLGPKSVTGVDLSKAGIDHCRRSHTSPNLTFRVGDAENLSLP